MNKAERTRRFIIEKSASIINRKGMAGTSLSDIMEATKLAKGGIYGNFENKEEICMEAFLYLTETLARRLDGAVNLGRNAKEKFHNLLEAYKGNKDVEGGCPILNFGVEADDTHPNMKVYVKKAINSSQKRILNIISDGIANEEISSTVNPKNFSVKVFAMIEGAILCRRVVENDEQMRIVMDSIWEEFESFLK
ncbi:TetR/AcrR family transcriptional regulator [Pedobacter hiemivivus]|uniref:TetR/AcrR family transcriptional regulator n=1 Tax=Pedobacter hiemivivus TaxID=2530454 RepID=A0A4R0NG35_9SPHI|nr:TetR/AcrR family transcriptional regulator [Pedobacter hiemivivus]TCC99471.1 TetR/AcrR family transcriptional regulator [Pedobacter hiemivivus]TKC63685.1 TetR/AcrR family transcriptional regulator [Pedobacter hiemivivus]